MRASCLSTVQNLGFKGRGAGTRAHVPWLCPRRLSSEGEVTGPWILPSGRERQTAGPQERRRVGCSPARSKATRVLQSGERLFEALVPLPSLHAASRGGSREIRDLDLHANNSPALMFAVRSYKNKAAHIGG